MGGLTEVYALAVMERQMCAIKGHASSEGSREESFLAPYLLVASAVLGVPALRAASLQSLSHLPMADSPSVPVFSSFKDTSHLGCRSHPNTV